MLSPGISVKETNLTHRPPTVTTVTAGMAICAQKGPVNEAVLITSEDDYINTFGEPNAETLVYQSYFTAAGYLDWGNILWAVRVEGDDGRAATLTTGTSATSADLAVSYENVIAPDDYPLSYADMDSVSIDAHLFLVAKGPGTFYNSVKAAIIAYADYSALQDYQLALAQATTQSMKKAIAQQYYTGTTAASGISVDGLYFRIGTAGADTAPNGESWAGTISPTGDLSDVVLKADVVTVSGTTYTPDELKVSEFLSHEYGPSSAKEFILVVYDENDNLAESYLCSADPDAVDYRQQSIFAPNVVNDLSNYVQIFVYGGTSAAVTPISVNKTPLGGGVDDHTTEPSGNVLIQLNSIFGNSETIDVDLLLDIDWSDLVKRELDEICQERMDCFALLNVPKTYVDSGVESMRTYMRNTLDINSTYSAIYGQYFKIYDPYTDATRWVPATGSVAGVYAYNDRVKDAWWAPAGLNRGLITGILDTAINPDQGERDVLYQARVNPIVDFPEEGIVVWGQKTLAASASAFDRVNVRRLFIVLETAIRRLARSFLFEINDRFTRSRFVSLINPYLDDIKGRRGLYDFSVICNTTNNTPVVIDRNEFIADIYIKPARAIEFIKLNFVAVGTGVSFEEVCAS